MNGNFIHTVYFSAVKYIGSGQSIKQPLLYWNISNSLFLQTRAMLPNKKNSHNLKGLLYYLLQIWNAFNWHTNRFITVTKIEKLLPWVQ